jgi:hypothetical protein
MLEHALGYAARGWPVFPCHPETKRPLVAALPGEPKGSGGLKRATTSRELITQWWTKWPNAMIGVPTGPHMGAFVVDCDAGTDDKTGEVFEADALIAALEAELGAELPETLTAETPRGGRHLYFATAILDMIGNRAGVIPRVDIRGDGGYVIVPPSRRADGREYRWLVDAPAEPAPAALLDCVLRRGRWGKEAASAKKTPSKTSQPSSSPEVDAAVRRYALSALDQEARKLADAVPGTRNQTINEVAFVLGTLAGAGALSEALIRATLQDVVAGWPDLSKSHASIESGLSAGVSRPRDLAEVRAAAARYTGGGRRQGASLRPIAGGRASAPHIPDNGSTADELAPELTGDQLEMRDILRQHRRRRDPPAIEPRGGARAGQWNPDRLGLPKEDPCPVVPLGYEGEHLFMLNSSGQLVGWTEQRFTHAGIQRLFSATPNWPEWAYPRLGRAKKIFDDDGTERVFIPIESFKDDEVRKGLFRAIDRKGMFSPDQKVRGRGAWKMADGALYYHAGEELWIVEGQRIRALETGVIDDGGGEIVFPRMAGLLPPWPKAIEPAENPARELIKIFRRFNWDRPDIDPILFLGWIGVAFYGGALDWRSAVFLVGDKGTGKSTLQSLVKELFGDALMDSANATAASIYQRLSHDSRPVAIDEIEASGDNRKVMNIMELARQAASGAFGQRGSSDSAAGGVEFQMRSAFLFSAINTPPLLPQDLSRFAMLRLRELPQGSSDGPVIVDGDTAGRKILTQLMLNWHRWPKTLEAYRKVLADGGHSGRGQDTYGTLLAAADCILGGELAEELDIPMVDDLSPWSKLLHVDTLPEVGDALANWRACINHLMQSRVPAWRSGERATVGQLIEDLDDTRPDGSGLSIGHAKRQLAQAGLGLSKERDRGWILAVPNQSPLLEQLFYGSRWQGAAGAGGWSEALRSGPRDVCLFEAIGNRVRINGVQQRCTLIVLARLDDDPGARRTETGEKARASAAASSSPAPMSDGISAAPAPAPSREGNEPRRD